MTTSMARPPKPGAPMTRPFRFATPARPLTPFRPARRAGQGRRRHRIRPAGASGLPTALSPITALAAYATHTTTLRFGPLTANAGLWRPDVPVREFLTADQISGGRVEVGVGTG